VQHALLFNKQSYFTLLLIIAFCAIQAQNAMIHVTDATSSEPIEYVHLIFTDEESGKQFVATTDINGYAENLARGASELIISFVGYETIKTTVLPNTSYDFQLNPGTQDLEEVVVTAQYTPVAESNSVYKVQVLNREFIDSRAAITLHQLLNNQLNIRIAQDNVLGSSLQMQGLGGNNVKILLDGVPLSGRLNGNIDLSQINLDNIERVEMIEGPMSVVYGSNALAGTINLITKKPRRNRVTGGGKFYYESVGAYNTDFWANLGTNSTSGKVNIGRNFFGGWSPESSGRSQQWNQKEQYFSNGAVKQDFAGWDISLMIDGLWEQIKDKGDRRSEFSNYAFDTWFTTNRWMTSLASNVSRIPNHHLNMIGSYTWFNRSKITYNRDLVNLTQEPTQNPEDHDTTIINTALFRSTLSSDYSGRLNYQLGVDLNWENTSGGRIEGTPEIGDYALFGSLQWHVTDEFLIQPGIRYAYNTQFNAPLIPSLNFQYKPTNNTQLRLSFARGFRAPSLKEMYLEFVDANHNILGNEDLQPENSQHIQANFSWITRFTEIQKLRIEPSLFYNNIESMINLTQIRGTEFTYLNIDEYTTFGGKIQVAYSIHPDFDFAVGYAHLGYTNQLHGDLGGDKFLYSPEVSASFNYWRSSKRFRFNVIYKYNGDVPGFRVGDIGEAVQTIIPAYNVLDVTASYAFFKNRVTLSAGAKNLFNVMNLDVLNGGGGVHSSGSFPVAWGRTYFLSLKMAI
jgi:outer membrane receptor for ferrienterochelin and colicins